MLPIRSSRAKRALFSDSYVVATPSSKKARTLATQASVRKAILDSSETKYSTIDGPWLVGVSGSPAVNINPSSIASGGLPNQRIGNKVLAQKLDIRLNCSGTGGVRLVIYCPKDPQAPATDSLLDVANLAFDSIDPSKFWVIHDQFYTGGDNTDSMAININKKLNHHIHYKASTGGSYTRNPVFIFLHKEINDASSTFEGYVRLWYKDI